MILVTHNVEEAVMMSDRVLVWDSNPGKITDEFVIEIPRHERNKRSVLDLVEEISDHHHMQIANAEDKRSNQLKKPS
jgi:NitT/TauT family transport system ATP-binding protein